MPYRGCHTFVMKLGRSDPSGVARLPSKPYHGAIALKFFVNLKKALVLWTVWNLNWARAPLKIASLTLMANLDRNWNSF